MNELVNPAANLIDSIQGLDLKLLKLGILSLKLFDLPELLIELLMVRMQHGGLEGQCRAADGEDADWKDFAHDKHGDCYQHLKLIIGNINGRGINRLGGCDWFVRLREVGRERGKEETGVECFCVGG